MEIFGRSTGLPPSASGGVPESSGPPLARGGEPLTFRALSDRPWLSAEPYFGIVSGQPVTVRIKVDRSQAGAETHAVLRVNSTGGTAAVDAFIARDLSGTYAGEVRYESPFAIAGSPLRLTVTQSAAGTSLNGFVEPSSSLLYPFKSEVNGTITGDDVTLTFVVAGATSSTVNPHYPRPIRRTISLSGKVKGIGLIEGTLTERLSGPYESKDITLRGTFMLRRSGPPLQGSFDPQPTLTFPPITNPFPGADYDSCRNSCPYPGGCSTPLNAGDSYLKASATFYQQFQAGTSGSNNPYEYLKQNCGAGCLNVAALRCAQYHYGQAVLAGTASPEVKTGFLDSLEVLADYALFFGNDQMVQAFEKWKEPSGTLSDEVGMLQSALGLFTAGSHTSDPARPQAMLDPFFLKVVSERIDTYALSVGGSRIPTVLGDYGLRRRPYEHIRRQVLAVGGALRTSLEKAEREHRLGRVDDAKTTTLRGAMQAFIDVAILSSLLEQAGATPSTFADISPVLADFEMLSRRWRMLVDARNPAGYGDGHVPFLIDVARLPKNNYQQIHEYAVQNIYAGLARNEQDQAKAAQREYEQDVLALLNQMTSQQNEYERQLIELCGTIEVVQDMSKCGRPGSALDLAVGEVRAAALRIQLGAQRLANLTQEIAIEEQRAREVSGVYNNSARMILSDGTTLRALDAQERWVERAALAMEAAGNFLGALSLKNPGEIFQAIANTAAAFGRLEGKAQIENARRDIQTTQQARVEFDRAKVELINSAAVIKTKMLESATLALELEIARENAAQAANAVLGIYERAKLAVAQRARVRENNTSDTRKLLHFRVYADALSLKAQESFRLLMEWAYLATRAMEYELNLTYGNRADLWLSRSADDVNRYLVFLDNYYQQNRPGPAQTNVEVISVRDHLLDLGLALTDKVTSHVYQPADRFRHFVADPASRDADGNLRIRFMTYRPDKPMFSRAVCNDRIKSVRVNLIGDDLGPVTYAFVRLSHGGTNYLRACTGTKDLVAYDLSGADNRPRVARIQAGVNAPNNAAAMPANTDLISRALIAGPWELVIDQRPEVEPANANLNVAGLRDIELIIEHESYTLQ